MAAKIISKSGSKIVVEVEIDLKDENMLDKEMAIRAAVNQAGRVVHLFIAGRFDRKKLTIRDFCGNGSCRSIF